LFLGQVPVIIEFFASAVSAAAYRQPLPLPQASWRRRLEVFSPKLDRRLSLGSYEAWRCWVALEANPAITTFCERPTRVAGKNSAMVDFWVQLNSDPRGEFWLLDDAPGDGALPEQMPGDGRASSPRRLHERPMRLITAEVLASWDIPVANWAQILPYLVSFRRYRQALLEQSLVVALARSTSLDEVLATFSDHDASEVQAALYWLLAGGRVRSPDIATAPLSGATRFRRA
jgi:hypothetical protein